MIWIIFGLLQFLVPILLIGTVIVVVRKRMNRGRERGITVSPEDNVSQLYMLIAVAFLGVTLMSVSRDFGDVLSWRAVFLITSVVGLALGYYFRVTYLIPISLIGLVVWWDVQAATWMDGKGIRTASLLAGPFLLFLLMYVLGRIQEHSGKWRRIGWIYSALALLSVTAILFVLSTSAGLQLFSGLFVGDSFFAVWQVSASVFVFVLALLFATVYALGKREVGVGEASVIGIFVLLILFLMFVPPQEGFYISSGDYYRHYATELGPVGYMWAAVLNLLIFFELVGVLFAGYYKKESWLVNFAMLGLFFFIIVKYFDWFSTMLNRSVFFIGAGILLLVIGWFMEKGRRYMLRTMTEAPQTPQLP